MEMEVAEAEEATVEALVTASLTNLPEDPAERARMRLARLRTTFAATLAIVAEMHRDRDWEHLTREDGTAYSSLAEVMVDVFNVSISMARRYVQGARDFYLPLSELTVEGTRIEITSGDVATLGKVGIEEAIESAKERLDGVEDPEESSRIISEAVANTKERKAGGSPDYGDGDGTDFDGYDPGASRGAERFGGDLTDDLPDDDDDDYGAGVRGVGGESGSAFGPLYTGLEEDEDENESPLPASGTDAVDKVLAGAQSFDSDDDLSTLPPTLKEIANALRTLAKMDPVRVADLVDYDSRGVLLSAESAVSSVKKLRANVETSPWFIARLSQS